MWSTRLKNNYFRVKIIWGGGEEGGGGEQNRTKQNKKKETPTKNYFMNTKSIRRYNNEDATRCR